MSQETPDVPEERRGCSPTSYSFIQVPLGFLFVAGAQRLTIRRVEEAVVVERRLPVPETLQSVKDSWKRPDAPPRPHLAE